MCGSYRNKIFDLFKNVFFLLCPILFFCSGVGLFIGMELVKDRVSKQPATEEAAQIVRRQECFILSVSLIYPTLYKASVGKGG